jgi:hypothetical protein
MNMLYVWPVWLFTIVVSFAGLETFALTTGRQTLSRFVWELSAAWPPFPWIAGFITGFLVCHFWWGGSVSFAPVTKVVGSWFH